MKYQVIARKYRPQTFSEVLGQDAIITTLKHAMQSGRLAHAYLFSGPRGTGKTTTARILAKAINCPNRSADFEPCNQCSSCSEITAGHSLDILEIDGASHRGIEHIRQINETAGYATSSGGYKIYIIDEVHMLTKEAFNALLKTLEEPPEKVKFFFATTEPHKVLPTILSRCQHFHLNRISNDQIVNKLKEIVQDLGFSVEEVALQMIATRAEGGLRDAESLLDQALSFQTDTLTAEAVSTLLGIMPTQVFFELDEAARTGNIALAFQLADSVFSKGKDIAHFIEGLIEHFRNLLILQLCGPRSTSLTLAESSFKQYQESAKLYTKEQCIALVDYLLETQQNIRYAPSSRVALETILMRIIRIHQQVPVEVLIQRLHDLESRITSSALKESKAELPKPPQQVAKVEPPKISVTEDPTPKSEEIPAPSPKKAAPTINKKQQSRNDTLLQFAAVELEGTVKKV